MSKALKITCIILCATIVLTALYFVFALFGNPVSLLLAQGTARNYLKEHFSDTDFHISEVGYNLKTGGYYAHVVSPSSLDSYFTIHMNGWGQYHYDTYESISAGYNTFSRLGREYNALVDNALQAGNCPFDVSIVIGELTVAGVTEVYSYTDENGEQVHYTMDKEFGLDIAELVVDGEYDIRQLGASHGRIIIYIHDTDLSTERAAELLLAVKNYLDAQGVPFHAIEFHLCEPRNENGQNTGVEITLFDFLYSDVYEDDLITRVQEHWDAAKIHYAIQDSERQ